MEEEFRICIENNKYSVSNFGRLRNNETNKILKGSKNSDGYMIFDYRVKGVRYHKKIHRFVAMAFIPNPDDKEFVDHIDNNRTNNNAYNLRWCTNQENGRNRCVNSNKIIGTKGVYFRNDMKDTENNKNWRAIIMHNGVSINLGSFKTKEEATIARMKKATELFGEFVHKAEKIVDDMNDLFNELEI
jgi:hypothetical protein